MASSKRSRIQLFSRWVVVGSVASVLCLAAGFVAVMGIVHGGLRVGGEILGVLGIGGIVGMVVAYPIMMVRSLTGLPANPFSARARALTDPQRAEWAPGENPDPADVIELDPSFSGPSPEAMTAPLTNVSLSPGDRMSRWRAPRTILLDRVGIRHRSRMDISFAIRWRELSRVALQVHSSNAAPLAGLRLVVWPAQAEVFAAEHEELDVLRMPDYQRQAWGITISETMADAIDMDALETTKVALQRFAGALYDGTVENA